MLSDFQQCSNACGPMIMCFIIAKILEETFKRSILATRLLSAVHAPSVVEMLTGTIYTGVMCSGFNTISIVQRAGELFRWCLLRRACPLRQGDQGKRRHGDGL